jgi:tetratricopeptide (TPR) repeat protein
VSPQNESSKSKKAKFDSTKTSELAKWRGQLAGTQEKKISQRDAALFFGLSDNRGRETIGLWENGLAKPDDKHRITFIRYLWDKLQFSAHSQTEANRYLLIDTWNEIMVEQWQWPPLTDEDLWQYVPTAVQRLLDDPPPFLAPPKDENVLIGRDDFLSELKQRLFERQTASLQGLPGVGKTAVALALAYDPQVLKHFRGGVLWAGLGQQATEANVFYELGRWGKGLGLSQTEVSQAPDLRSLMQAILDQIRDRQLLLVIDDAWDIELAQSFRVGGEQCGYVLTTRKPDVAEAFSDDKIISVPPLSDSASQTLISQFVPKVELTQLTPLIEAVGGIPLQLNLIALYLRNQAKSVIDTIADLENTQKRLGLDRYVDPLHRSPSVAKGPVSQEVVIALSYDSLFSKEKAVLQALSVFPANPNSFSMDAALAVARSSTRYLLSLVKKHGLLQLSGERYNLHQTISDFSRQRLTGVKPYHRLAQFFVTFIETNATNYDTLDEELTNIFAALEAADEQKLSALLIRGATEIYPFLETRGVYSEAQRHLERAEVAARDVEDIASLTTLAINLGRTAERLGTLSTAKARLEAGLRHAKRLQNQTLVATVLFNLGTVASGLKDLESAQTHYEQALTLARQGSDDILTSKILGSLSRVGFYRSEFDQAEQYNQQCLELAEQLQDEELISKTLMIRGVLRERTENPDQAESDYQAALYYAEQIQHNDLMSGLLNNLARLADQRQNYTQAQKMLEKSLILARQANHLERIAGVLANLVGNAMTMEAFSQGEDYYKEATDLIPQLEDPVVVIDILNAGGELYLKQSKSDDAVAAFTQALDIIEALESEVGEWHAKTLFGLARTRQAQDDLTEAKRLGNASHEMFLAKDHPLAKTVKQWLDSVLSD